MCAPRPYAHAYVGQILYYKDFSDIFSIYTRIVNVFPSFAMDLGEAYWRSTYLYFVVVVYLSERLKPFLVVCKDEKEKLGKNLADGACKAFTSIVPIKKREYTQYRIGCSSLKGKWSFSHSLPMMLRSSCNAIIKRQQLQHY